MSLYNKLLKLCSMGYCNLINCPKGKQSFNHDKLFDGGNLISPIHGKQYREVRQYQDPQHLVRFYFATKIYSSYIKEILCSLAHDAVAPDYIIIGSCLWDISR